MPPRVLISDPLAQPGLDLLYNAGLDVDVRTNLAPAELIAGIPGYDALIIRSGTQVTANVIAAADQLHLSSIRDRPASLQRLWNLRGVVPHGCHSPE